jgi:hypothetical protein
VNFLAALEELELDQKAEAGRHSALREQPLQPDRRITSHTSLADSLSGLDRLPCPTLFGANTACAAVPLPAKESSDEAVRTPVAAFSSG